MITIFTPVYNRAYIIENLYHSLLKQSDYSFEWLIVDDGSTDHISELVNSWINNRPPFQIRFYRQNNGGKHRAINKGVLLAHGDAFFIVDSDDYLTDDAVENISKYWEQINCNEEFAGVSGLRTNTRNEIIGGMPNFEEFIDVTNLKRKIYGLNGDKAEVYKTEVLKQFPFPEFEGETFLTEAVVWDKIAYSGLKIRWFNKAITICEYRSDGLTNRGLDLFVQNPIGWGVYIQQRCSFYNLSYTDKMCEYFDYYIELKMILDDQEMKKNLQIDEELLIQVKQMHRNCIDKTIHKIGRKLAIYGAGARGKKILKIYSGTEIEICFILDKNTVDLPYLQIKLDEQYPYADAIIVTPKYEQTEIVNVLKRKTSTRIIPYDEWRRSVLYEE